MIDSQLQAAVRYAYRLGRDSVLSDPCDRDIVQAVGEYVEEPWFDAAEARAVVAAWERGDRDAAMAFAIDPAAGA